MIPELMNTIALLKREEERDTLRPFPVRGKLTHYQEARFLLWKV